MLIESLWMRAGAKTLKMESQTGTLTSPMRKGNSKEGEKDNKKKAHPSPLQPLCSASLPAVPQRGCCALGCCPHLVNGCLSLHCCHVIKIIHRGSLNTQRASARPAVLAAIYQRESVTLANYTQNTKRYTTVDRRTTAADPGFIGKLVLHLSWQVYLSLSLVFISLGHVFSARLIMRNFFIKTMFLLNLH